MALKDKLRRTAVEQQLELQRAAAGKPLDLSTMQIYPQGGHYWAVNPRTGQPEPIVWSGLGVQGAPDDPNEYYFQSEAPAGVQSPLLQDNSSSGFGDLGRIVGAGLGMGGGVLGANLGSDIVSGDPLMPYGNAAMLDAAGLAAGAGLGASGVLDAGTLAAGTGDTTLLGQATEQLGTEALAPLEAGVDGGPIVSNFSPAAGGSYNAMTGAAAGAGAGSALSNLTGWDPNLVQLGGVLAGTGLGIYGAGQAADAYGNLAVQLRQDRLPYLEQSQAWLNDPNLYFEGPGQAALQGNLRALSIHGNPAGNPWALATANEAALRDWRNAVSGFGNLGLGGEATQANLGSQGINAEGGIYDALGYGIGQVTQPRRRSLADVLSL